MYKQLSSNDNISYTLVSLIKHDGKSLDCGHYFGDVFDSRTGIWWHYNDDNITKISDLTKKGLYFRESQKKEKICQDQQMYDFCLYQNKPSDKTQLYYFQ